MLISVYGPLQKYEIAEATPKKARLQCVNCELWNHAQAIKITDDLCSVHSQYWWDGFVKGMNPKMTSGSGGLKTRSKIMVNQTRAVDKIRLVKKLGHLPPEIMSKVALALKLQYSL